VKSRRRANRRAANSNAHFGISNREIAAVATVAILAGLGYVLWRGRDQIGPMLARLPDHLPDRFAQLPQLPAPDDVRDSVTASWRAALNRLPKLDPDKLGDVSRGFDALKQLFVRA
jgi:hypothetical protein